METIIIQVIAFQFIFLFIYEFLLKRDTFFNWNRAYLLGTSVCSLVLPFVKINAFSNVIPADYVVNLPTVFIGEQSVKQTIPVEQIETVLLHTTSVNYYVWFWSIGAILCACLLVYKLFRIGVFQYASTSIKETGCTIATLKNSEDAFSFLNTIFLGDQLKADQKESILKHEKVHVKDKHTLDLLWFELLRIIFWFNPLIYIYQKRITEVHEFIADKSASKYQENYYENLLAKTFNVAQFSLVNQFYSSSLIKKRIIMLTKKQSNKIKLSKFLTIIPVVLSMLIYVSCSDTIDNENTYLSEVNNKTTVIEDVITIVNNTMTYEEFEKGISEDQFNTIIGNLKEYKKVNSNKIDNTDFNEYSTIWDKLYGSTIQNFNETAENKDLYNFKIASVFAEMLLKDIEDATYEIQGLMSVKMLLSPKIVNRLEELNYVLPNKEKYLKMASEVVEETKSSEISFKTLDQSPIFPGCDENSTSEELKKCFSKSISKHVGQNFNTKLANDLNLTGRQKILVAFKIDELGEIKDIKVRAEHDVLADEAKRVIEALPKLKPGKHNGQAVTVPYTLPIVFQVQ